MPWSLPQYPGYAPPRGVAASLGADLGSMGDRLKYFADQKRAQERQAMLDQRTVDWRGEDLARENERFGVDLALQGVLPTGSSAATAGPSFGPGDSMGTRLGEIAGTMNAPTAPAKPTVSYGGQSYTIDPDRSVQGLRDASARERAEARRLALVESLTPFMRENYGEQGGSMADAVSRGVSTADLAYRPLTQNQQRAEVEFGTNEQIRAGAPGRALEERRIGIAEQAAGGGPGVVVGTEGERKGNMSLLRAREASAVLDAMQDDSAARMVNLPFIGRTALTDKTKKFEQATQAFLTGVLRAESGATITDAEMDQAYRIYIPSQWDSPEVRAQKAEARARALEGLQGVAGRAAAPVASSYSPDNPFAR